MKRFYSAVQAVLCDDVFIITLDEKPVRTPAGATLNIITERLAQEIAKEWRSQGEEIQPHKMGLTTLACTTIDRVAPRRKEAICETLKYAEADMLCYHAQSPSDLAERQRQTWLPLLDWAREAYNAKLNSAIGIVHMTQPPEAISALRRAVEQLDDLELTALSVITATTGSLVIALALLADHISADEALQAAELETVFQNERWGEDAEDMARREKIAEEVQTAAHFLKLARTG